MCERLHGVRGRKCFTCCAYKEARDIYMFDVEKFSIVKFWVGFKASLEYSKISNHIKLSAIPTNHKINKPGHKPTNQQPGNRPTS